MGDRRHLDRPRCQIDPVAGQSVDDRAERRLDLVARNVLERQINPAMRRSAAGGDFSRDRVGGQIPRRRVPGAFVAAIAVEEFLAVAIQQPAAELVAERVPHDRVHADEPRRQMSDREELNKFHVDELGAGGQRQRVPITAHIRRGAVAAEDAGQAAVCEDHRFGRYRHRRPGREIQTDGADRLAGGDGEVGNRQIADAPDGAATRDPATQCRSHRRPCVEEVDITAARARMPGRSDLCDPAVVAARPADAPALHLANAGRRLMAQDRGERLVAQSATRGERVREMQFAAVGRLFRQCSRHRHLRHDRRAAAADEAFIDQQHRGGPGPRGGD
jgi:hypothetical protein